ncbi:hypothetical protein TSUD_118670 [Trifolium subterraneum]|uniref:KEN domain-containing protein n=1 Tax=Trifolium subterraneum TaxID=3900 RepID=A0A2Z6MX24_TRISU|nr:hypothetical protein TSUD_118670 [Trifolium subterraneum]
MIFHDFRAKISLSRCRDPNLPSRNKYEDMDALADIVNYCLTYGATTPGLVLSQEVAQLVLSLSVPYMPNIVHSNHVSFWSSVKRMHCLSEASMKLLAIDHDEIVSLEEDKIDLHGGNESWRATIDAKYPTLWDVVTDFGGFGGHLHVTWTRDLIRFIRNTYHHRNHEAIKLLLGGETPTNVDGLFSSLLPVLLARIYEVASTNWMSDEVFVSLLGNDF